MSQKIITCDECKHEFVLESVNIQKQSVKCENEQLQLIFFTCPKCNKIYRVSLLDARYEELKVDLENVKRRIRRNHGSNNQEMARVLSDMVIKKTERMKNHCNSLRAKYSGTFVFEGTEIKYLP